jgi:hypothetical protein
MPKKYKDAFTNERRLAYVRFTSQCRYRDEECSLTFSEFCHFWNTQKLWIQRGRKTTDLVLTRYDNTLPWNTDNCCIITRQLQLDIRNKRRYDLQYQHLYKDAIAYGR